MRVHKLHDSFGTYIGKRNDSEAGKSLADHLRQTGDIPPEILTFINIKKEGVAIADCNHFSSVYRIPSPTPEGLDHFQSSSIIAHGSNIECDYLKPGDIIICLFRAEWGHTAMEEISFHGYEECPRLDYINGRE